VTPDDEEPREPPDVTPALYLARCFTADLGFVAGHVEEAALLAEACDYTVCGGTRDGLTIVCIVDRDRDPARRFTMPPERVDEVAAACRHHTRTMGVRDAVIVEIWELGAGVPDADDRERLERYTFRDNTPARVDVMTFAVDTAGDALGDMVSTAGDSLRREAWIRKILEEPRRSPDLLRAQAAQHHELARAHRRPVVPLALLAAFAVMYLLSLVWTVMPNSSELSPGVGTLLALGALHHGRVDDGEWWRVLTYAFLHGGLTHLVLNGWALYIAGRVVENLAGRVWTLALFMIGALGGSVASLAFNPANATSVGASGAIMGLFGVAIVLGVRLPRGPARNRLLISLGFILVMSLVPIADDGSARVDYAAHVGGALAGAFTGGILFLTWRRDAATPRGRRFAFGIAAVGLLVTGLGIAAASSDREEYRAMFAHVAREAELDKLLAPDEVLHGPVPIDALIVKYPRDPRVQKEAGYAAFDRDDFEQAIVHLEKALAERELFAYLEDPVSIEVRIRAALSESHAVLGNHDTASAVLLPMCDAGKRHSNDDVRDWYDALCP
jgi:rhomboid protease GluP